VAHNSDTDMESKISTSEQAQTAFSNEPFVTEHEVAEFLGLGVRTLQRWRFEPPDGGGICFYQLGPKRILYRLSDCQAWAEARVKNSTSEEFRQDVVAS